MSPALGLVGLLAVLAAPADPPRAAQPPRFEFTTFGSNLALKQADRVVEAEATSVMEIGNGIAVARFRVVENLLGKPRDPSEKDVVVLAAPGDFAGGVRYALFLQSFRNGGRYVWLGRIAAGERDYASKLRVLRQFASLDRIEDPAERARRIKDALLGNLADADPFVRWNSADELIAFAKIHGALFLQLDRARVVERYRAEKPGAFRDRLKQLLEQLGVRFDKER